MDFDIGMSRILQGANLTKVTNSATGAGHEFCKGTSGRDRNAGRPAPLAQIPACATNALGSCLGFWRQSVEPGNPVPGGSEARIAATAG